MAQMLRCKRHFAGKWRRQGGKEAGRGAAWHHPAPTLMQPVFLTFHLVEAAAKVYNMLSLWPGDTL